MRPRATFLWVASSTFKAMDYPTRFDCVAGRRHFAGGHDSRQPARVVTASSSVCCRRNFHAQSKSSHVAIGCCRAYNRRQSGARTTSRRGSLPSKPLAPTPTISLSTGPATVAIPGQRSMPMMTTVSGLPFFGRISRSKAIRANLGLGMKKSTVFSQAHALCASANPGRDCKR